MSSDDDPDQPDIPGKLSAEQYAVRESPERQNRKKPASLTPKVGIARKTSTTSSSSASTIATLPVGMASLHRAETEQFLKHTDIEEYIASESSYIDNEDLEHKQSSKNSDHEDPMPPLKGEEIDKNSNHSALKTTTIQNNRQNRATSEPKNIANVGKEEDSNYDNGDDDTCDVSASSSVFRHTLCVLEAEEGENAVHDYMIKNYPPRASIAEGVAVNVEEKTTNGLGVARLPEPHEESLSKYVGNLSHTTELATDDHNIDKEFPLHGTDNLNTCCPTTPPLDHCETSEVQPGAVRVSGSGNTEERPRMVSESSIPEMYPVEATLVEDEASQRSNPRLNAFAQAIDVQVIKNRRRTTIAFFIGMLAVAAVAIGLYFGLSDTTPTPLPNPNTTSPSTPRKLTLDKLNEEKVLRCGVPNKLGFSSIDALTGDIVGFEVDLCKAVAAAVFGGRGNDYEIKLVFITSANRFEALANGTIDVIMRTTTHTLARDIYQHEIKEGLTFSIPYLYDGLAFGGESFFLKCAENFMRSEPSSQGCDELRICVDKATTHIDILKRRIPNRNIVELSTDVLAVGLANGFCNTIAGEMSEIGSDTVKRAGYNGTYEVGTHLVSKEPLAIVTKDGDNEWSDFVDWVLRALLFAEQEGITQSAANKLNQTDAFGPQYVDMFINAVSAVGNYGEMYDRHLNGVLPRHGLNLLNKGDSGLMYSHPFGSIEKVGPGPMVGGVIKEMVARKILRCGISRRVGFGEYDGSEWSGLDVDYCRALSASIFGDSEKVEFVEIDPTAEIESILKNGEVEVIAGVSPNIEMDSRGGLHFSVPYFYEESSNDSRALATSQDDDQWSTFVYWVVSCTFYAEEESITRITQNEMPLVESFGSDFVRMFRDAISAVGNYGEMYIRNVNSTIPRKKRNMLNFDPVERTAVGAQHFPSPIY
eukprot:CAMPEP_0195288174 /NCGR_PEP_ID=MMETSP0707-20130614/4939_1 /TAXON_ID=33640 /ORGANISM="Asterionellopsis glacialis, Strain CCMP134" /LENGTH=928 /DNA_ID=CAMNT_0040348001 /DNA_START=163 /DNA_END=2949 /DNA_ORIENTATION=+